MARRFVAILLTVLFSVSLFIYPIARSWAETFQRDASLSQELTDFLQKKNQLPLVNAEVLRGRDGKQKIVLYGFVQNQDQRMIAELRAGEFVHNPAVEILNQIKVRPQLQDLTQQQAANNPAKTGKPTESANPESTENNLNDIQAYLNQYQNETFTPGFTAFGPFIPMFGMGAFMVPPLLFGVPMIVGAPSASTSTTAPSVQNPASISSSRGGGVIAPVPTNPAKVPLPPTVGSGLLSTNPTSPVPGFKGPLGGNPVGELGRFPGVFRPGPGFGRR